MGTDDDVAVTGRVVGSCNRHDAPIARRYLGHDGLTGTEGKVTEVDPILPEKIPCFVSRMGVRTGDQGDDPDNGEESKHLGGLRWLESVGEGPEASQ